MRTQKIAITLAMLFLFGCTTPSPKPFDVNAAMQKAGNLASPGQEEFYMFYVPENSPPDSTANTVQQNLKKAAQAKATVAIVGPDSKLNYQILKNALAKLNPAELQGAEIIFIGEQSAFPELENLTTLKGASFKATSYP